jgi:hypothetical protein
MESNKFYKMKHIPTGLYFQPHKHRGSHLSKNGKIYQTKINGVESGNYGHKYFRIACQKDSQIHKLTTGIINWTEPGRNSYGQLYADTEFSDWVKEFI